MILHRAGQDTRLAFEWLDEDDLPIVPTEAEFHVDGAMLYSLTVGAPALSTSALGGVTLHLDDLVGGDEDPVVITPGNHTYRLRAKSGGDWTILSAGLLRVR